MNSFERFYPEQFQGNPFNLIGTDWMLITAGTPDKFNTMTASWGGLGVLWNRNVCFCFVRPQRYTFEFMEKNTRFSLSFFEHKYRDALMVCGSRSGREIDKVTATGLTPVTFSDGSVYFQEAKLVMICEKLYAQDLHGKYAVSPLVDEVYPEKDYHRMYIGEVSSCLKSKETS